MDFEGLTMMGGAFVPLMWMMGLSNYYTGSKRLQPLGFAASSILGLMTFIGAITAVISLMAICNYDVYDVKNQSSMPIYILALFLLCMDLWLDHPASAARRNDDDAKQIADANKKQLARLEANTKGDVIAHLTLILAAATSFFLMKHQQQLNHADQPEKGGILNKSVSSVVEAFAEVIDMRTVVGSCLALPLLLLLGRNEETPKCPTPRIDVDVDDDDDDGKLRVVLMKHGKKTQEEHESRGQKVPVRKTMP